MDGAFPPHSGSADTTGKLSLGFQQISIYFGALGYSRSKAKPKRIYDVGELLSFTVRGEWKEVRVMNA